MTGMERKKNAALKRLKAFITNNIAIKVLALVFAMLLWGYVLTDQKPMRIKTVPNVSTSFDGEGELMAQSLCVRGNRKEILQDVTVAVRSQITNYAYLSASSINAVVSLKNISEARTYTLPVTATVSSALGVVQSISPSVLEVEIDTLVNKTIPVTTSYIGELPEGYWADMDAASVTTRLDISGAKTDLSRVVRAECIVPLSGHTSTIYRTFDVILYDADENIISQDIIVGTLPTSTVRLPIYPMKSVPINVDGALIGTDNLAANHVLYSAVATPADVRIVGSQAVIENVTEIELEPISISGMSSASTVNAEIIMPEGARLLDTEPVTVYLDIRESAMEQSFEQLPIETVGLERGLDATLSELDVDLTVSGRYSIVSILKRSDISVFVDVTGLTPGTYLLPVWVQIVDDEKTIELATSLSPESVTVSITGR